MWAKLVAVLSGVVGVLVALLKFKSYKLDKAEHELEVRDKKDQIADAQDEFIEQVLDDEQKRNNEKPTTRSADDLNSL